MPLATRCPTGPFVMRRPRGVTVEPPPEPPATGPLNLKGSTRAPMTVICIGQRPGNPWHYRGVVYLPGQQFQADPLDVPALVEQRRIQVVDDLPEPRWWDAPGRILQCEPGYTEPKYDGPVAGSLKVVQGTGYDPGNAAYRFHTAVNEHSRHCSAFVRWLTTNNNPFKCPAQYDAVKDPRMARALLLDADVVHCHVDYLMPRNLGLGTKPKAGQLLIRHYHGTQFTVDGKQLPPAEQVPVINAMEDDAHFAVLVGARLTLCALRPDRMRWLPITVPVARYAALAVNRVPWEPGQKQRPFRVAHSPTKSILKGTTAFLQACKKLTKQGLKVEPVMIERKTHANALALKATADACFDAFSLGIQGSGLEAAAMGQPVIAGDAAVRKLYQAEVGECPYTYADVRTLMDVIARLATDADFYATERRRVNEYVTTIHDYPAVAARYDRILTDALGRRKVA